MKNEEKNRSWVSSVIKGAAFAVGAAVVAKAVKRAIKPPEKLQLEDKVVLITGGGRGLGLILARKLAEHGATIVICGRSEETLSKASADLATRTDRFLAIPCNITDKEQVRWLIEQVKEKVGSVDVLINNAGNIQVGPVNTMDQSDFEEAINVHFWGPYYLIHEVLPDMKEKKSGNIVNICSIGSKVSFPHLLPYNTSKYALSGLSEGLSAELRKFNINVTTIYPGLMRTGSPQNIDVKGKHKQEYAWFKILDSLPLISINADRAADKIIEALRKGQRTLTLSVPAKLAVAAHGIAPAATIAAFNLINYLLPDMDGTEIPKKGYESESKVSASFLTKKTDEAARKNLEV